MNTPESPAVPPIRQDDTSADVILRSTDKVDFRISKELLSKTSMLFQTMLSMPQPTENSEDQEFKNGVAVIPMEAEGSLLRNLLLFCNPTPEMVRLDELQGVAMKYEMYEVAKQVLRERTRSNIHLIPRIMLAAIEKITGQNTDAHLGAVATLLFPEKLKDIMDLELITRAQVDSLVAYRKDCVAVAVNVATPTHGHYTWMSDFWTTVNWFKDSRGEHGRGNNEGGNIYIGNTSGKWMMRYWWRAYIYAARDKLEQQPCDHPYKKERYSKGL